MRKGIILIVSFTNLNNHSIQSGEKMKSLLFMFLILITSFVYSQEKESESHYALSFGIRENFTLDRFNGDIAFKIVNNTHQWRLFISPDFAILNSDEKIDTSDHLVQTDTDVFSIGIGADYLWTILRKDDLSMLAGTGITGSYGKQHEKRTRNDFNGDFIEEEMDGPVISAGVRGILGIEWMVSDNIGIHTEYLMTLFYQRISIDMTRNLNNAAVIIERDVQRIYLNNSVLFGVSFYL
jgi:hypothetical protein